MSTEKRLIDANDAEKFAMEHILDAKERFLILDFLREGPTVDDVEVVRCAFCKACVNIDGLSKAIIWCNRHRMAVSPHDFCSHGERKNDG